MEFFSEGFFTVAKASGVVEVPLRNFTAKGAKKALRGVDNCTDFRRCDVESSMAVQIDMAAAKGDCDFT